MNDEPLPREKHLQTAAKLMTSIDSTCDVDVSELARLVADDGARQIRRLQETFLDALERIDELKAAGLDHEVAVGAAIELVTGGSHETGYREALFRAFCAHLDLTKEEANECSARYRSVASAMDV